jgi:hypothetical protein
VLKSIIEFSGTEPLSTIQSFYIADKRIGLKPNLLVLMRGQKWFETNSWGMKGPEPPIDRKLVGIWGDSVVFGVGSPTWVDLLNQDSGDYYFLNAGIEGCSARDIVRRAINAGERRALHANIIFPGWHPTTPKG